MTLTVASYNIHKCAGLDRRVDLDRIAQVLEEIDADLVGVQEVFQPQALGLAERLGMQVAMGPTRERDGLPYGNAVLTRLAIRGSRTFDLSRPYREPRGGIRLDLEMPGAERGEGLLHVFNVHFGLKIRERAEQVRMLVREHILHDELTGPAHRRGRSERVVSGRGRAHAAPRAQRARASAARIRRRCRSSRSTASTGTAVWAPTASTCTAAAWPAWRRITCRWSRACGSPPRTPARHNDGPGTTARG